MTTQLIIENSSNLIEANYEPVTRCLFIEFKSVALYRYDQVPEEVFNEFASSESKGAYLAKSIKGKYTAVKLKDANPDGNIIVVDPAQNDNAKKDEKTEK